MWHGPGKNFIAKTRSFCPVRDFIESVEFPDLSVNEGLSANEEFQKKKFLNFNLDKSEQMIMQYSKSKKFQKETLILNGQVIKEVESYKYLGSLKITKEPWICASVNE